MNDDNADLNVPITESEVRLCMEKIKNGKPAGLDDIYPELLKFFPDELFLMIIAYFNKILDRGIVPDDWATSIYQPNFKKEKKWTPTTTGVNL